MIIKNIHVCYPEAANLSGASNSRLGLECDKEFWEETATGNFINSPHGTRLTLFRPSGPKPPNPWSAGLRGYGQLGWRDERFSENKE